MRIERQETWGTVIYETSTHRFSIQMARDVQETPYISRPVVLNVDLTFKCNMVCKHCVAKDMEMMLGGVDEADLIVTERLINDINKSRFMVVVITGGEPLLHNVESPLLELLTGLDDKGIIIDTNGTLLPSNKVIDMLLKKQALVRVSWDSQSPNIECQLRKYPKGMFTNDESYMRKKEENIQTLVGEGLAVAAQTVLHRGNLADPNLKKRLPYKFKELGINSWYIQRFIPSYKVKNGSHYDLRTDQYEDAVGLIARAATEQGITCFAKKDRRHNSVFLLVKDGELFTQSDQRPGVKVRLGNIASIENYFEYVSSSEHSIRYIS